HLRHNTLTRTTPEGQHLYEDSTLTRTTPEPAPPSKLPRHDSGRTFGPEGFNVHQTSLHGYSAGGSDIK
ncbi:hypothetical protein AVEN_113321-1, partial [Araneus ventricosus]